MKLFKLSLILTATIFATSETNADEFEFKVESILDVKQIHHIDVSPDGKSVVYSITETLLGDGYNDYKTQLWVGPIDNPDHHFQFTRDNYTSTYGKWSPDGKAIGFISNRNGNGQLYGIQTYGGEAIQITNTYYGVETFKWSPDGKKVAIVYYADKETSEEDEENSEEEDTHNLSSDVVVKPYERGRSILAIVDVAPYLQDPQELTTEDYFVFGHESFDWAPDSKHIAFTYSTSEETEPLHKSAQIAVVNIETKEITKLPKITDIQCNPFFSPCGNYIAFSKSSTNVSVNNDPIFSIYDIHSNSFTDLSTPMRDNDMTLAHIVGWTDDSSSILCIEPYRTRHALWNVPIDQSRPTRIDNDKEFISNISLSNNKKYIACTVENTSKAPEIYVSELEDFNPVQVTKQNALFDNWEAPRTEIICWKSYDGTEIEGLLTYPKNYIEGEKYPLLLRVHGGPMCNYNEQFLANSIVYPNAPFAEEGFFLFRPNPRGSSGYGEKFRKAVVGDWGGKDFEDLMSGVDALVNSDMIDPLRMGVLGWSYGGYMTAWIVTQTNQFAAASMGAGVSNLTSMAGTTDIDNHMVSMLGGENWENLEGFIGRSPITFANQVETPLMIQHGHYDVRVPYSQSLEFYKTLMRQKKDVILVGYPRSGHTVLEPELRLDCLQRNLNWFIKHVRDK